MQIFSSAGGVMQSVEFIAIAFDGASGVPGEAVYFWVSAAESATWLDTSSPY